MTQLRIEPGACGLTTTVKVRDIEGRRYEIMLESECEMVQKLASEITELSMMDAFTRLLENPVYRASAGCLRHVSCPVPSGILKALEVAAGLAVPKDVCMHFSSREDEDIGGRE